MIYICKLKLTKLVLVVPLTSQLLVRSLVRGPTANVDHLAGRRALVSWLLLRSDEDGPNIFFYLLGAHSLGGVRAQEHADQLLQLFTVAPPLRTLIHQDAYFPKWLWS